ncbi:unnamed protein product [Oncorhynchus mykiss]|uniref:EF-hand domain-containing protein n=1 Tax=Oncorhynchus mykiss TaxID=8022 RepID=A0A060WBF1_ONCMY|nr:unnamed protein product [Oncorhynchus mykiss]
MAWRRPSIPSMSAPLSASSSSSWILYGLGKLRFKTSWPAVLLDVLLMLRDEELSKVSQESNWFSAPSALRVYCQYLNLDKDHNGMLSKEELSRYGTGTLTSVFLDCVYLECLTYDGEIDYKTYVDFVLALENRKKPAALQYIFKLLDMGNKGYLNVFALNYFFRVRWTSDRTCHIGPEIIEVNGDGRQRDLAILLTV